MKVAYLLFAIHNLKTMPTNPRSRPRKLILWRKNKSLLYHLYPPKIAADSARFSYTFGLGGIAAFTAMLTALTGLMLMFYYQPTQTGAHASLAFIDSVVAYGRFVRAMHYWAAQAMVIATVLHMARVVFTGGYRPPRDVNWLIGLALLVITLLWDFSGYVLRYDADSIWALLVGTNLVKELPGVGQLLYILIVGGQTLNTETILRFYVWHVFGLALIGLGGIGYHLWRIHVDGGLSRPDWIAGRARQFVPRDAVFFRDIIIALIVTGGLALLSMAAPPPLGPVANLNQVGQETTPAPWIFLAIQQMLRYFPPLWAGWIIPLTGLAGLAALAWFDRRGPGRGRWFAKERIIPQSLFAGLMLLIIILTLMEWGAT
jgi:quinol-cytochrome oxidoreductase complex cytochrome b subunit